MKNLLKLYALCALLLFFFGCSSSGEEPKLGAIIVGPSLEAAISTNNNCITTINFEDLNNNVYAYRADAGFATPTVQAGGHSTIDESTDLGFNMFIDPDNTDRTNYTINNSGSGIGTAYIFYIVGDTEYISSGNGSGNLVVEWLDLDSEGKVLSLKATFNNVEVVNNKDANDKRCVSNFVITF